MLKCVQFQLKNVYDVKMDVALPLDNLWDRFADFQPVCSYEILPCSPSLIFKPFNMKVVEMDGGGLCACFQHAPKLQSPGEDAEDECEISYSVFVLHHGCTLTFTIPLPALTHAMRLGARLHFSAISDMLCVFLPGHVLQLVDCGAKHEPIHHLIVRIPPAVPLLR